MAQVAPGTDEERLAREQDHRQGEHPGGPAQQTLVLQREVPRLCQIRGRGVHHHLHHAKARHQPAPQRLPCSALAWCRLHQVASGKGTITGPLQGRQPVGRPAVRRRPAYTCGSAGTVDQYLVYAGQPLQNPLHRKCTGGTRHALDRQVRLPAFSRPRCNRVGATESLPFGAIIQCLPGGDV